VEELDEDEDESYRKAKKSKPSVNGSGSTPKSNLTIVAPSADVVIEEVDDVAMEESANSDTAIDTSLTAGSVSPTTSAPRTSFSFKSTSAPKEPSKLRYSYQPDGNITALTPASAPKAAPTPVFDFATSAAASAFTFAVPKEPKVDAVGDKKDVMETDPKVKALVADVSSLPTFVFTCNVTSVFPFTPAHVKARSTAISLPLSSLPTFDFNTRVLKNTNASASSSRLEPAATPFAFGAIKPTASSNSDRLFSTFTLFKPPANTPPDVPHLADVAKAPPKAFNWSAAGVAPPPTTSGDNWTCSMCMLSNPATATEKCGICDNPR
jgi:hypothetical protein